jgi:hypothetical protein
MKKPRALMFAVLAAVLSSERVHAKAPMNLVREAQSQSYWSAQSARLASHGDPVFVQSSNHSDVSWGGGFKGGRLPKIQLTNLAGGYLGSLVLRGLGHSDTDVPAHFGILDLFILSGLGYLIQRQFIGKVTGPARKREEWS